MNVARPPTLRPADSASSLVLALLLSACSGGSTGTTAPVDACLGVSCGANAGCVESGGRGACTCAPGFQGDAVAGCTVSPAPSLGACSILPADHLFNTPIDGLAARADSDTLIAAIGSHPIHLDLGQTMDSTQPDYYGIPYNVVHGGSLTWSPVHYGGGWPDESDCAAAGATSEVLSPCSTASPVMPVPASPLVEGGINVTDEDHHLLVVDADTCRLWELYHATPSAAGGWDVLSTATFDLGSDALRPAGWTSADAAGFPILPLLLRADEAASGTIRHALRVTLPRIRAAYTWPARHLTGTSTSASLPPMGQLFRIKASYAIPAGVSSQTRAILQALKTYGMYLADGGSTWYVQGEPSAAWDSAIFDEVRAVTSADIEAVDLTPLTLRAGWSVNSARVPPP
jgi:hypothetical protein